MGSRFVLCFHSGNPTDYLVLPEVLRWLSAEAYTVLPLHTMATALIADDLHRLPERVCGLSFDDGMNMDFEDVQHPTHGAQPAFATIMRNHMAREIAHGRTHSVHATSFVIASRDAREQIQTHEMLGYPWMSDSWWAPAVASNLFHIGNHSWDHLNANLRAVRQKDNVRGDFTSITTYEDADAQIRAASAAIASVSPSPGASLFAYPYGHRSQYLIEEYLPLFLSEHRTIAAFGCEPSPITNATSRWEIPRFVYGTVWSDLSDLARIARA